jgi:hypothetical protein
VGKGKACAGLAPLQLHVITENKGRDHFGP